MRARNPHESVLESSSFIEKQIAGSLERPLPTTATAIIWVSVISGLLNAKAMLAGGLGVIKRPRDDVGCPRARYGLTVSRQCLKWPERRA